MGLNEIIVVVPVKNEAWVLEVFLKVTLKVADAVLIAYQSSEDDTLEIAQKFDRVTVLQNPSEAYNNATRQQFLLSEARRLFPGPKVILALDADEILSADSLQPEKWDAIRRLPPGTLLYLPKTDLVNHAAEAVALPMAFYPLGFVDDGLLTHSGKPMHSVRIPLGGPQQPKQELPGIHILHLQRLRPRTQEAKRRFYQVKENDFGMNRWYWRRKRYNKADFLGWNLPLKPTPNEWLFYPGELQVNLNSLFEPKTNWFDYEVSQILRQNGSRRYWLDDIWDKDWAADTFEAIKPPPFLLKVALKITDFIFSILYKLKSKWLKG